MNINETGEGIEVTSDDEEITVRSHVVLPWAPSLLFDKHF